MNFSLKFLLPKLFAKGEPKAKNTPLYAVFSGGKLGSIHEELEDAKTAMKFKDRIIVYKAQHRVELEYTTTDL